ncbi:helix-turn-helix domain-containing protein [Reyranella sp. CPCC 100927]|uniref:MerR family transcriptional regulator n=1 Tax=Reyranella sp. CPCC 100927 TaxID=2599616 RepID=UPI0011B3FDAF|nr:helix-turn-helix domain-containing protein [Reyranella sp. CPCC 100927]TWS94118.1 helix-turn-helix domain-containing protein [Reyranella sp. CPCC 100927]
MTATALLPIGALAKSAGVPVETIRYYEREGLLPKPGRSRAGYRLYHTADAERLQFIRRARDLGFSLEEVRQLLGLADRTAPCDDVRTLACTHLSDVRAKLADLRRVERTLAGLVKACARDRVPDCRLLQALARPQ